MFGEEKAVIEYGCLVLSKCSQKPGSPKEVGIVALLVEFCVLDMQPLTHYNQNASMCITVLEFSTLNLLCA